MHTGWPWPPPKPPRGVAQAAAGGALPRTPGPSASRVCAPLPSLCRAPPREPPGLPLVGSHAYFARLAAWYGPIFSIRLDSKLGMVVSSLALSHETQLGPALLGLRRPRRHALHLLDAVVI
ncbi:hypothetical protein BS78_02G379000 [Paspalum vaginatum]|nr:hypothetical protein BS78_02G379000 [Paspalum vaginatum]